MSKHEFQFTPRPSGSPKAIESQNEPPTQMHSVQRRPCRHYQEQQHGHHQHQHQHQHVQGGHHSHNRGHGHGNGHHHGHRQQKVLFHVYTRPKSSRRRRSTSRDRRNRPASSRAKEATRRRRNKSVDSQTTEEESEVSVQQLMVDQLQCQLCARVREMRLKSGNLTNPTRGSDVVVRASDGKVFYCHSFVLEVWAPNLLSNVKSDEKQREFEINVPDFPGDVVSACLTLMYGGPIDGMPLELLDEMMKLSTVYQVSALAYPCPICVYCYKAHFFQIPTLKAACVQAASSASVTPANACQLWQYTVIHKLDLQRQRAMQYVLDNLDEIMNDPRGKAAWDAMVKEPEMLLDLFYYISECTVGKPEEVPARDTQMDELWERSNGLLTEYAYPDVTIVTKDGKKFYAHLPLLTLSSPKFANMLDTERRKNQSGNVYIADFDDDVVEEFLRGLYRQDPSAKFPAVSDDFSFLWPINAKRNLVFSWSITSR